LDYFVDLANPIAMRTIVLSLFLATAGALELTEANWDEKTAGKSVFVKFLAPW
jgi:hypothetical protein